jgi:NodT family efflux transporter outer membrane factor (OMF) lipoprotein
MSPANRGNFRRACAGAAMGRPTKRRLGGGVLAVAVMLLGACVGPAPLPPLPQQVPADWHNAPAFDAALGTAPNLDTWWHAFDDATLDALIERARAQNLTVAQAQQRLRGARASQHRSATQFKPQVSFHTFAEPDPNGSTSYFEIGFDALWEFGFFGRRRADARVASADAQNAATDVAAVRVSIAAEIARNYMDLRAAQARAALLDGIVAQRREKLRLAQKRVELRIGTRVETDRAEGELAQATADANEPASAIVQAQQALAVLLAEDAPDSTLTAVAPQPLLPPLAVGETPADLLRTRPEIRKAELNVLKAAGELGLARADLYPKLALGGSLTSSTRVVGDIDRPNKGIPAVGPVIQWPIFDWGARHDLVDARAAALQGAVLAYRQTVLEGVAEAESALAQLDRQQKRVRAGAINERALEHAAQSVVQLRGLGLADAADTANAALAAAQAQLERSLATHDLNLAFIALYKSFGGTLPPLLPDPR